MGDGVGGGGGLGVGVGALILLPVIEVLIVVLLPECKHLHELIPR